MVRVIMLKPGYARLLLISILVAAHLVTSGTGVQAHARTEVTSAGPASGPVLLSDDFTEPSERWIVHTGNDHRYDYEHGEYVMTLSPWSTAFEISTSTELLAIDYQLDVEARLLPASANGSSVVLGVRQQRNGASYRAGFDPYANTVQIYEIQGWSDARSPVRSAPAAVPVRTSRQTSAAFHSGGAKNRYSLRAQGAQLTALVNGEEVVSVSGVSLTGGGILIGVGHARDGLADARFDNLLLTGLPSLPGEDDLTELSGGVR